MEKLTCAAAKQIDMVEYLASLNHHPQKVRNQDYWYLSPLRQEKTASFKVNKRLNLWYDFGLGKGGDLIDFGKLYFNCSVNELLEKLAMHTPGVYLSFRQPENTISSSHANRTASPDIKDREQSPIVILESRPLAKEELIGYLDKRCIPLEIARHYCKEVDFLLYGKQHTVIGFPNNSGGYEFRNENFKGSNSPKDITLIDNKTGQLAVFEGFFSFLSFATINRNQTAPLTNCLVLNSLSFFEKSRPLMESFKHVHLCLDRDTAGKGCTKQALAWNPEKYIDISDFYHGRKDLNEWLIHHNNNLRLNQSRGHNRLP